MSDASVAILVPVLNRPHRVEPLLASIAAATPEQHSVIFACSDQPTVDELDRVSARYIRDEGGDEGSWAIRINKLYKMVDEPYIFTGADDLAFRPGWFSAVMQQMNRVDGVVAVNDLLNGSGVHFVISRNYIETLGGTGDGIPGEVMHPAYRHAFADDEERHVAQFRNRWAYANDAIVEHMHPGAGKAPTDETYAIGNASMGQGNAVFMSRRHLWGQ